MSRLKCAITSLIASLSAVIGVVVLLLGSANSAIAQEMSEASEYYLDFQVMFFMASRSVSNCPALRENASAVQERLDELDARKAAYAADPRFKNDVAPQAEFQKRIAATGTDLSDWAKEQGIETETAFWCAYGREQIAQGSEIGILLLDDGE